MCVYTNVYNAHTHTYIYIHTYIHFHISCTWFHDVSPCNFRQPPARDLVWLATELAQVLRGCHWLTFLGCTRQSWSKWPMFGQANNVAIIMYLTIHSHKSARHSTNSLQLQHLGTKFLRSWQLDSVIYPRGIKHSNGKWTIHRLFSY